MAQPEGTEAEFWDALAADLRRINLRIAERSKAHYYRLTAQKIDEWGYRELPLQPYVEQLIERRDAAIIREWVTRPMPKGEA